MSEHATTLFEPAVGHCPLGADFDADATDSFPDAERRRRAADVAAGLGLPSTETEEWRYSPIGDVELSGFQPATEPAEAVDAAGDDRLSAVVDRAASVTVVDGWISQVDTDPGWQAKGLVVGPSTTTAERGDVADGANLFEALHLAFAPDALQITVPDGLVVTDPIVIRSHHRGGNRAAFGHIRVVVGAGASATVLELQTSTGRGLSVPRVELQVADAGHLEYAAVQDLGSETIQIGRQVSSVGRQGTLRVANGAFGGHYCRQRTDTELMGRGAHGELLSVYFGDDAQIHDFRTFQHHIGADTTSDLLFKGAVDDESSSIYTGMIHIHPDARGSNAHQTNRNIKLSEDAWAWSVPNLEIENNDVRCSHASTVSPVETDQRFYLAARGVPPTAADRLIVAGFFDEVIERMPEELRGTIVDLVAAKLDHGARPDGEVG